MEKYLIVMAGGALGSAARYAANVAVARRLAVDFPLGTLLVNASGSFLVGLFAVILTQRPETHPYWRLFLVVGVLGGYTTFSTFEFETYSAFRDGAPGLGLVNVIASVTLGYAAVWLGAMLGRGSAS